MTLKNRIEKILLSVSEGNKKVIKMCTIFSILEETDKCVIELSLSYILLFDFFLFDFFMIL